MATTNEVLSDFSPLTLLSHAASWSDGATSSCTDPAPARSFAYYAPASPSTTAPIRTASISTSRPIYFSTQHNCNHPTSPPPPSTARYFPYNTYSSSWAPPMTTAISTERTTCLPSSLTRESLYGLDGKVSIVTDSPVSSSPVTSLPAKPPIATVVGVLPGKEVIVDHPPSVQYRDNGRTLQISYKRRTFTKYRMKYTYYKMSRKAARQYMADNCRHKLL